MLSDLKYAFRQLAKHPGFSAVAVLILALGVGSNTAVFSVIDALLLRGLPVSHPEGLVLVSARMRKAPNWDWYSYPLFEQLRDHAQSLAGVAAFEATARSMMATGFGQSEIVHVRLNGVSGNFFSFLGVPAFLGRTLMPGDDRPNAPHAVVVLSYSFWQRRFGADPAVVGKKILIDNVQFAIAGVAAPRFYGVVVGAPDDMWMPIRMYPALDPHMLWEFQGPRAAMNFAVEIMARLRPGVKRETASAELDVIFWGVFGSVGLSSKTFAKYGFEKVELQPGGSGFIYDRQKVTSPLEILMIVVGVALLVACANVASLLLARIATRQREFALRLALGAGRGRRKSIL